MNYFNEINQDLIIENILKELNLTRKTKKFWEYLFENVLLPPVMTSIHFDNETCCKTLIFFNQARLAKKYNEPIKSSTYFKKMLKEIVLNEIRQNTLEKNVHKIVNISSTELLKESLEYCVESLPYNYSYIGSYELINELLHYFTINELFKMNFVNEKALEENIHDFDKELFYRFGFKSLSTDFIIKHTEDMELLDISDTDVRLRHNIGIDKSPIYLNGGCCLENKHPNGADIYIPYGIWNDLFKAINISEKCLSKHIHELKRQIDDLKNSCEINDKYQQNLINSIELDIEELKKRRLLLQNFSSIGSEV